MEAELMSQRGTKTTYNGRLYDSKLEASVAAVLDNLHVAPCLAQMPIMLRPSIKAVRATRTRGARVGLRAVTYVADWVIYPASGLVGDGYEVAVLEAKGRWTPVARLKMRLLAEYYPTYEVVVVYSATEARDWILTRRQSNRRTA